ncbi:hypothetical protein [Paeniglutamicibacter kerguelensis]|uniref:Uncharacterized protein n=1 Tax=Paeniglutamicibacter kerguelensis TaxID=254788 RepID=A0ABS4XHM5_9MICC|nr:hypothetical protein [Paeniglutamicibacter kerguelensis]MBP2387974.1 hypothetical protein [Paeniglutamicibacter kerguelensis]
MGPLDPDDYQELLAGHDETDDAPVRLTRYQAQKCAAILTAGPAGHTSYAEATDTVARFLQALALDLTPGIGRTEMGSAALWQELDELPRPAPGVPASQPT